ncbi:MAG: transposase, partial [bacterium]
MINILNKLGRKNWNIKILLPYDYADGVIIYLGRYLKGGPMKESRLISFNREEVTFQCRGTRTQP